MGPKIVCREQSNRRAVLCTGQSCYPSTYFTWVQLWLDSVIAERTSFRGIGESNQSFSVGASKGAPSHTLSEADRGGRPKGSCIDEQSGPPAAPGALQLAYPLVLLDRGREDGRAAGHSNGSILLGHEGAAVAAARRDALADG